MRLGWIALMGRVGAPSNARDRARWPTLISVLAIVIQCFVVQIHVHNWLSPLPAGLQVTQLGDGDAAAAGHANDVTDPVRVPADRHGGQKNCYLCQTALAGAAILSSAPAIGSVERNFVSNAAFSSNFAASSPRSHNWRSRAPPIQL